MPAASCRCSSVTSGDDFEVPPTGHLAGQRPHVEANLNRIGAFGIAWHSTRVRTEAASRKAGQAPSGDLSVGPKEQDLRISLRLVTIDFVANFAAGKVEALVRR